ncbi:glycosyltransferase family 4 protein [Novosphingobium sp. Chol11]|uniref:glycosyltransferase family 4 protein n=1 Tax=Novosphingobium sp. Chol11 TaxID=1385763 RepID=UPI0025D86E27|nr:glycosyltransferase family 4 protein [Novosphingobium sp. Chol11]
MKILVSDYSGHPFQVQLSRSLARRGHTVRHAFSAGFQTPKGNLTRQASDPDGFDIVPIRGKKPFAKSTFFARRQQEIEIGHALAALVADFRPDVIISSNAPLDTQRVFQKAAQQYNAKFIFWLQDIYSEAISRVVPRKLPIVGYAVAAWYRHLEFAMLRASDKIVAITEDFVPILSAKGVSEDQTVVVENWAPTDELPLFPRENDWAAANMPAEGIRIVYSGTLGYKHNPALLLKMARANPQAHVMIFSEGPVADQAAADAKAQALGNFHVRPWVPFADLPKMLSAADVFVAVIEAEAGVYSVPSKILTYLAVGRPILASVPSDNLAARLITKHEAGFVDSSADNAGLLTALTDLAADPALRTQMGDNGRNYAAKAFDIEAITDRFIAVLQELNP